MRQVVRRASQGTTTRDSLYTSGEEAHRRLANSLAAMLQCSVTAEGLHEMGRDGAMRIRRWLDHTGRFSISHTAYDLDDYDHPYTQVRVEQLDGRTESFDLVGDILGKDGQQGNTIYVECKAYSEAGNQGTLYRDYLAVAYSYFAHKYDAHKSPPSVEFMWVTTHPFAVTTFSKLTTEAAIAEACAADDHKGHLGGHSYNPELGALLAKRLWLCIVNDRMLEEMLMGRELRRAMAACLADLARDR